MEGDRMQPRLEVARQSTSTEAKEREARGLGSLFVELTKETSALVRAEVALARSELQEKLTEAQRGAKSLTAGGVAFHAGALALVACAILALAQVWDAWLAALVVGLATCAIGAILLISGRNRLRAERLKPERTAHSLQQAKTFAKEQVS